MIHTKNRPKSETYYATHSHCCGAGFTAWREADPRRMNSAAVGFESTSRSTHRPIRRPIIQWALSVSFSCRVTSAATGILWKLLMLTAVSVSRHSDL